MNFNCEVALQGVAGSSELRRLLGKFATDERLADRFLVDAVPTLRDLGASPTAREIDDLRQVLLALRTMTVSEKRGIINLTIGADNAIT